MNSYTFSIAGLLTCLSLSSLGCAANGEVPEDFSISSAKEAPAKNPRFQRGEELPSWDNPNNPYATPPMTARECTSVYHLILDSRYPSEDVSAILSAWEEWQHILGNSFAGKIEMMNLSSSADQAFEACLLKIVFHPPPETYLGWTISWMMNNRKPSTSRIWFQTDLGNLRHQVFTHELGHFLGVPHSTDPASVMNPASYADSVITAEDKRLLCSVWGCAL